MLPEVFMFINTGSGGGIGQELVGIKSPSTFIVPESQYPSDKNHLVSITVNLFNLKKDESRNGGF